MKKWIIAVLAFALVFAPQAFGYDHVDAKRSYKSGVKSFDPNAASNKSSTNMNATTNKSTTTPASKPSVSTPGKGSFMKGLLVGGLAGLLFGSLFANMGALGSIFGLLINLLAVVAVVALIRQAYRYFKNQRKKQELDPWKR